MVVAAVTGGPSEAQDPGLAALAASLSIPLPQGTVTTATGLSLRTDLKSSDARKAQGLLLILHALNNQEGAEPSTVASPSQAIVAALKNLTRVNPEAWAVVRAARAGNMGICDGAISSLRAGNLSEGKVAKLSSAELLDSVKLIPGDKFSSLAVDGIVSRAAELEGRAVVVRVCTICQLLRSRRAGENHVFDDAQKMLVALTLESPGAFEALVERAGTGDRTSDTAASAAIAAIRAAAGTGTKIPSPAFVQNVGRLGELIRTGKCGDLYDSELRREEARFVLLQALNAAGAEEPALITAAKAQLLGDESEMALIRSVMQYGKTPDLMAAARALLPAPTPAPRPAAPSSPTSTPATPRAAVPVPPPATKPAAPVAPKLPDGLDAAIRSYILLDQGQTETRGQMHASFTARMGILRSLIDRAQRVPAFVEAVADMGNVIDQSSSPTRVRSMNLWLRQLVVYWNPAPAFAHLSPNRDTALQIIQTAVRRQPALLEGLATFASPNTQDPVLRAGARALAPLLAKVGLPVDRLNSTAQRYLEAANK